MCRMVPVAIVEGLFGPSGGPWQTLGDRLVAELESGAWTYLQGTVAFVKTSGVNRIADAFLEFSIVNSGGVSLAVGLDMGGSSIEAVADLFSILELHGNRLLLVHNPQGYQSTTYHPKAWLFGAGEARRMLLGSGNLTSGGLYGNYEAGSCVTGTKGENFFVDAAAFITSVSDPANPEVVRATPEVMQRLHDDGDLPSEDQIRRVAAVTGGLRPPKTGKLDRTPVFTGRQVKSPPIPAVPHLPARQVTIQPASTFAPVARPATTPAAGPRPSGRPSVTKSPAGLGSLPVLPPLFPLHRYFYITVEMKGKTEVYFAKRPLTEDPAFFGAPFRGLTTPRQLRASPQPQVDPMPIVCITLHLSTAIVLDHHELKMWTYSYGENANDDFRVNLTAPLMAQIPSMSVLQMERDPIDRPDLQYRIDIYPPTHADFQQMLAACTIRLPNSTRSYGWL